MDAFSLIYCATGDRYSQLAINSIVSFRAAGGDCPIVLFSDSGSRDYLETELARFSVRVEELANPSFSFHDKIAAIASSDCKSAVFVDCDTYFPPIMEGGKYMGKAFQEEMSSAIRPFDILALPGFGLNVQDETRWASLAVGQYNTGVIAFTMSSKLKGFLKRWSELYSSEDPHDQPSFRKAIVEQGLRVGPLMLEYNFQGNGLLNFRPRLLHLTGNYRKDLLLDQELMREMAVDLDVQQYPLFAIDFGRVHAFPSLKRRTLGAPMKHYRRGLVLWILTRFEIFFFAKKYWPSL